MGKLDHGGDIYRNKNVIDYSSNCNPLGPPRGVVDAICSSAKAIGNYPDPICQELKGRISDHIGVPEEYIFVGNGAAEVIFTVAAALKPRKALIPAPSFSEYEDALKNWDCQVSRYYMGEDLSIKEDFLEKITEDIDVVFLCNPNNPTGVITKKEIILNILNKCESLGAYLILDECFLDFAEEKEALTLIRELDKYKNLVILKAFTKLYAMAGVRLGYALSSNKDLINILENIVQPWNVSSLAQAAGLAALEEKNYVEESLRIIEEEKLWLKKNLRELGLKLWPSQGNYLFFNGPADLYRRLLEKGFMIRDCQNYHGLEAGYYRIAVRLRPDNEKLVKAMKEILWQKQ